LNITQQKGTYNFKQIVFQLMFKTPKRDICQPFKKCQIREPETMPTWSVDNFDPLGYLKIQQQTISIKQQATKL